ncbi:hypothetical protein [Flavobacterium fluviale]|uniref:Uncharacterized protein n=1 Tax=Flavobacterium fluviale TaxID=2249356 RepID=A0A344LQC2_9FLAO|nr:hypothetical protein [Flavobacterium fluviale]AXB56114.1 hypothetical protein HYN86_05675 [Flavobacterium fluviale]
MHTLTQKKNIDFNLKEIIQGYVDNQEPLKIEQSYNKNGIAYLPNLGYYKEETKIESQKEINQNELLLQKNDLKRYETLYHKGIYSTQEFEKQQLL